jgi:nitrate/nitrite-specific signal transduction histidine kinase
LKGSLRHKIIAWSFVPTAIVLVTVTVVSLYAYQQATETLIIERNRDLTRLSARLLADDLTAYTGPLADLFFTAFDGVVVFDSDGTVLAAEPEQYERWNPDWLRDFSQNRMPDSEKPVFSDIMHDELRGQDYVVVLMPTRGRQGKLADRTQALDGQDIVASYAPVPGTAWGLVTEESWAELTRSSRRFGHLLFFLLALGVAAPTVIVAVGIRRITQPIADLIGAAQEIAGGHFGERIAASSGDELEELAHQFNLMATQLQESYAHLEQKVADRTRELATLNAIAVEVSRSLDLEEILNHALDQVLQVMGMESGQAFRLDEGTQTLVSVAHRGLSEEFVRATSRLPLGTSLAGHAAKAGQPAVCKVVDYPEGELKDLTDREGLQSVVSIPPMVHGRCVGAISLGTRALRSVTSEELALLGAIGHQIGVAVENAQLYEQAQQLAAMKERNRLARDLHDSVTQALYGITLYAEASARQLLSGERELAANHLREIQETAQASLREMRLLIFELRLPMLRKDGVKLAGGLPSALSAAEVLQARLEAVEGRVGLETAFQSDVNSPLCPEIEEGLYRIAHEALNNTLRHARARSITVQLHQDERTVSLEITDDGIGFDPSAARELGGFGLRGMEERAARLGGELIVHSSPGKGTRICVEVRP